MESTPPPSSCTSNRTSDNDPTPSWSVEGLVAATDRLLRTPGYRPPMLPRAALAVLELARRSDVPFPHIVRAVEMDPVFTATVLRVANTPAYRTRVPATSIEQAVSRMGLRQFSDICLEAAMNGRVFRSDTFAAPMEQIRKHSSAVAHISRLIAQSMGRMGATAFGRGLLHDIGLAMGILVASNVSLFRPMRFEIAWPVIYAAHGRIGRMLIESWQLDAELLSAVDDHVDAKLVDPAIAVLRLANEMADDLGLTVPQIGERRQHRCVDDRLLGTLQLTVEDVERIRELAASLTSSV